ncbi:MAG: ABC transporter ATP-binding protein [Clostridiales bacterium]|nr:ABC transporter ATP-binding protein [Clostridiales bacterium]
MKRKKLKLLLSFIKGNKKNYIIAIFFMILATITSLINPLIIKLAVDSVIDEQPVSLTGVFLVMFNNVGGREVLLSNLWILGCILILISAINGIFNFLSKKHIAIVSERTAKNMRNKLYDHIQYLSYSYHIKVDTGDLIQRCTSDLDKIRTFISQQLMEIIRAITLITTALAIMMSLNVKLSIVSFVVTPIIVIIAFKFFKYIKAKFKETDEAESKMTTVLQENLNSMRIVRAFAKQDYEMDKFNNASKTFKETDFIVSKLMAWYWGITDFICDIQLGAILILGTFWAANGLLTIGTLLAFMAYSHNMIWPIRNLGRVLADMGKASVSLNRISEIFDETGEDIDLESGLTPEIKGDISFENVSFEYEKDKPVLSDVTFHINKGQTIAILGGTGAGKTTLVNLLVRLFDVKSGAVTIDGINVKDINRKWLRKKIGIVLQEPFLFSRTIKENIAFSNYYATEEQIKSACKVASIYKVIRHFDKGFDTIVGEKGVTLSGGQKQRVAIARTLLNNHSILIFDDSLSAVDVETDAYIRDQLKKNLHDTTTIIISHRISTLKQADKILVIEKGTITQQGTHRELIREQGLYKEVFDIQSSLQSDTTKGGENNE